MGIMMFAKQEKRAKNLRRARDNSKMRHAVYATQEKQPKTLRRERDKDGNRESGDGGDGEG